MDGSVSLRPTDSTLLRGFDLHDRDGSDNFGAAALWALLFCFDALVVLRKRPDLFEHFVAFLAAKFVCRHLLFSRIANRGRAPF